MPEEVQGLTSSEATASLKQFGRNVTYINL